MSFFDHVSMLLAAAIVALTVTREIRDMMIGDSEWMLLRDCALAATAANHHHRLDAPTVASKGWAAQEDVDEVVHASLLPCTPSPSVTQAPSLVTWQYAEPDVTAQYIMTGGIDGAFASGGGGDGLGGGGGGTSGGIAAGVVEPQIVKPPACTE